MIHYTQAEKCRWPFNLKIYYNSVIIIHRGVENWHLAWFIDKTAKCDIIIVRCGETVSR